MSGGFQPSLVGHLIKFAKTASDVSFDSVYSIAVGGVNGFHSVESLAAEYLQPYRDGEKNLNECARTLVSTQSLYSGAFGMVSGLGGGATIWMSVPVALYFQIVAVATVAKMGGHDLATDHVKSRVRWVIAGDYAVLQPVRRGTVRLTEALARKAVKSIPGKTLKAVNRVFGTTVITKAGTTGIVNLAKFAPFMGAVAGGTVDYFGTRAIGMVAIQQFIPIDGP